MSSATTHKASDAFPDAAQTWNKRFSDQEYLFGKTPNEWLRRHAEVWRPGQKVLCVADGEGRNSVWLAGRGLMVDAFDIAEMGVEKARRLAAEHRVEVNYAVSDCDSFAWPGDAYDGVAAIFVQFADPAMRHRLFNRIVGALKPGGVLILVGYTPQQLEYRTGGPPLASHLYTPTLLRSAFGALDIEVLVEYEADISEGSGHSGRSALIGLVARKPHRVLQRPPMP